MSGTARASEQELPVLVVVVPRVVGEAARAEPGHAGAEGSVLEQPVGRAARDHQAEIGLGARQRVADAAEPSAARVDVRVEHVVERGRPQIGMPDHRRDEPVARRGRGGDELALADGPEIGGTVDAVLGVALHEHRRLDAVPGAARRRRGPSRCTATGRRPATGGGAGPRSGGRGRRSPRPPSACHSAEPGRGDGIGASFPAGPRGPQARRYAVSTICMVGSPTASSRSARTKLRDSGTAKCASSAPRSAQRSKKNSRLGVLRVAEHLVTDAPGLGARAVHVDQRGLQERIDRRVGASHAAGHDDLAAHGPPPYGRARRSPVGAVRIPARIAAAAARECDDPHASSRGAARCPSPMHGRSSTDCTRPGAS